MEERVIYPGDLTPVQKYNGIYFKRDDLYMPYDDLPISGSKVRQHQGIIDSNYWYIKDNCDNKVYSALFLSSCQSAVIARVCREYGVNVTIFHGGTTKESIMKNKIALNAIVNKANIDIHLKSGYASVLKGEIKRRKDAGEKFFNVNLEEYADEDPCVLWDIGLQCENLPELDVLYVPIGSGVMCAGVLMGLYRFGISVKRVVGINISGHENNKILNTFYKRCHINSSSNVPFTFEQTVVNIPYHKRVKVNVQNEFSLDSIYEAKAYLKMLEIYNPEEKNGFWVSGNMDLIRDKVYNLKEALGR